MPARVIVESMDGSRFGQRVQVGGHVLIGDEPQSAGGDDQGPTPYEYLLTALGT